MIDKFSLMFPQWRDRPGILNDEDLLRLVHELGLSAETRAYEVAADKEFVSGKLAEANTVGVLLAMKRFREHDEAWHCVRLTADTNGASEVMNPLPAGAVTEQYDWNQIRLFDTTFVILRRA